MGDHTLSKVVVDLLGERRGRWFVAPFAESLPVREVAQPAVQESEVERKGKARMIAHVNRILAEQFERGAPQYGVLVNLQETDRNSDQLCIIWKRANIFPELRGPG